MSETYSNGAQPDLVYDLGMHDGQDTDFYLKKGFRVVAVEANPVLARDASDRFADAIASGQLTILNIAIADNDTNLEFFVNHQNSKWSSLEKRWGARGAKGFDTIVVKGRRLEDIVEEHGVPYYLKIDIEGADLTALRAVRHFAARPAFVSVEGGGVNFLDVFSQLGFDRFCPVDQSKVPETRLTRPAREGRFVNHSFPMGASGPFGHEIKGPWLDYESAIAERTAFRNRIKEIERAADGDATRALTLRSKQGIGWYDMHATTQATLETGPQNAEPSGIMDKVRGFFGR